MGCLIAAGNEFGYSFTSTIGDSLRVTPTRLSQPPRSCLSGWDHAIARSFATLAQDQEPRSAGFEARSRRGLGPTRAITCEAYGCQRPKITSSAANARMPVTAPKKISECSRRRMLAPTELRREKFHDSRSRAVRHKTYTTY
jgi:hypothetical protein